MKSEISRREFLKISSILPLLSLIPGELRDNNRKFNNSHKENILIIVFDAWSAHNISLYGYPRDTTPKLRRLAERAIVYHNHFSPAPWTLPGTGSLLTGVYPWTHRAFDYRLGLYNLSGLIEKFQSLNILSLFKDEGYSTLAYTHNPYADIILNQINKDIDFHLESGKLFLNHDPLVGLFFENDEIAATLALRQLFLNADDKAHSLLISNFLQKWEDNKLQKIIDKYKYEFPRQPPALNHPNYYYLQEDATDWLLKTLGNQVHPFLGYIHFYPPHHPYRTRRDFVDIFSEDWRPPPKPQHVFSNRKSEEKIIKHRRYYDEFIAYVDAEFARLFMSIEETGLLDNTWVVLTSDHGESFERGSMRHSHLLMHNPVIHIPLLIFPPGQEKRIDVYQRTSAIDLLPTLLHTMDRDIPPWCEGEILPPFQNNTTGNERTLYGMNPWRNLPHSKITEGVYTIFKENYKLIYYFGLQARKGLDPYFELYDIVNDPEELNNLYDSKKDIADQLYNELISEMKRADEPYT